MHMKKFIVLTVVAIASQAVAIFAGEPVVSSKQVVAPPPPPPEFFRPNEFDIGAFGNYDTGVGSGRLAGKFHAWGGGMDFTYWFPWKYAGVRFQGTGASIRGGGGPRTVTFIDGFTLREPRTVGGGSVAAGVITADGLLRFPLDEVWPGVHLAPYLFAGFGGILLGSNDNERTFSQSFTITDNTTGVTRTVNVTGRRISGIRQAFGTDRVLGHVGGGLEYRFTPHIGIFGEVGYDFPNGAFNNFVAVNFGLRYAF
jgi:hypothetical protein